MALLCVANAQNKYCSISAKHTMCQYKAKACPNRLMANTFTANDRASILKTHNDLRSRVANGQQSGQPKASNMRELFTVTYSMLMFTHRNGITNWQRLPSDGPINANLDMTPNRNTAKLGYVGQNVAITQSSRSSNKVDFSQSIQNWYSEVTNFNSRNIRPFVFNSGTGHYTQVVWAETDRIGCGYAYYLVGSWYSKLYVCNYGVGGNIQSGSMYEVGQPATKCKAGRSTAYSGLCSS
ncbi:hypothetical protein CHUAL_004613 [Chamberlinius hualienensis]